MDTETKRHMNLDIRDEIHEMHSRIWFIRPQKIF